MIVPPLGRRRSQDHWVSVFAHELAHVQRRDGWSRLIIELVTIVMPWQPVIWWLRRGYMQSSEEACDDWAVFSGPDPVDYASSLAEWIPRSQPALALEIGGWSTVVRRRMERLLEDRSLAQPSLGPDDGAPGKVDFTGTVRIWKMAGLEAGSAERPLHLRDSDTRWKPTDPVHGEWRDPRDRAGDGGVEDAQTRCSTANPYSHQRRRQSRGRDEIRHTGTTKYRCGGPEIGPAGGHSDASF
ncbi:MAG: M56 family metallopeptidase [Fuerstiella sp.]